MSLKLNSFTYSLNQIVKKRSHFFLWFRIFEIILTVAFEPVSTRNLHILGDQTQYPAGLSLKYYTDKAFHAFLTIQSPKVQGPKI